MSSKKKKKFLQNGIFENSYFVQWVVVHQMVLHLSSYPKIFAQFLHWKTSTKINGILPG